LVPRSTRFSMPTPRRLPTCVGAIASHNASRFVHDSEHNGHMRVRL
jgi:hypothetical protein